MIIAPPEAREPVPAAVLPLPLLPARLDGRTGSNRAREGAPKSIAADDDVAAIRLWLAEYADSPHTLRSYAKEVTRLLLWSTQERDKPVSSLLREDFLSLRTVAA
jgi:integrase/recombinase XerC